MRRPAKVRRDLVKILMALRESAHKDRLKTTPVLHKCIELKVTLLFKRTDQAMRKQTSRFYQAQVWYCMVQAL